MNELDQNKKYNLGRRRHWILFIVLVFIGLILYFVHQRTIEKDIPDEQFSAGDYKDDAQYDDHQIKEPDIGLVPKSPEADETPSDTSAYDLEIKDFDIDPFYADSLGEIYIVSDDIIRESLALKERRSTPLEESKEEIPEKFEKQQVKTLRRITGRVICAEDFHGLPGANVMLKDTQIGAITDASGNFILEIPFDEGDTLIISSVGYSRAFQTTHAPLPLIVKMELDVNVLSEIVVTGFRDGAYDYDASLEYTLPEPVNGHDYFSRFIRENLVYPPEADEQGGMVNLLFIVSQSGKIENIRVLNSPGTEFEHEAIRLLLNGPSWKPATENGIPVPKEISVNIRFRAP
ncbi:MAG: TonB family protein [Cyclobacteriaceae bacterium]|nr:TonB family protein [Cyclobacteriaceae bacterium]